MTRALLPFFFFGSFVLSCNNSQTNQNGTSQPDTTLSSTDTTQVIDTSLAPVPFRAFPLDSFPTRWQLLSFDEDGSNPHLRQYCDAAIPFIEWTNKETPGNLITFNSGQEEVTWDMDLFIAYAYSTEKGDSITGSIELWDSGNVDSETYYVYFTWETYLNRCFFTGQSVIEGFYVNSARADEYTLIEDECDHLW